MTAEHILVAVGAIIKDDKDRILIVRHKKERGGYWQGKWICPGGKLEYGEEIIEGIRREVKEETNLEIELITPLVSFDRIVKIHKKTTLHVIYIDYIARLLGGELRADSDVGEALWIEQDNIPKIWQELHTDTQRLFKIAMIV
ncbi:MAG: NUDIX domain-containing protein [Chloroflexota bacterium]|nr:NUDIX domain-containing protein [Chloroflexota bacterium]